MNTMGFSEIATRYERDSLIQKSAADKLLGLLDIRRDDCVLDLGCGTGSLSRRIRALTDGRVVGVDPSEGMIREAEAKMDGLDISFAVNTAEGIKFRDAFNVIFCNSVFQWFREPTRALNNCYKALRQNGRLGIQAPAKKKYCPNFLNAMDAVAGDPRTAGAFAGFSPPWLFLDTAEEYATLFIKAGFAVPFSKIEQVTTLHTPDEVMTIFESGAAAGYLNQQYYQSRIDEAYTEAFRGIVRGSFRNQANEKGQVELIFNRIYLLAVK